MLGAEVMADMAGRKMVKRARRGLLIQSMSVRLEGVEVVEAVLLIVEGISVRKVRVGEEWSHVISSGLYKIARQGLLVQTFGRPSGRPGGCRGLPRDGGGQQPREGAGMEGEG